MNLFQGLKKDTAQVLRNKMLNKSSYEINEKSQNLLNLEPRIFDWGKSMTNGGQDLDTESVYSDYKYKKSKNSNMETCKTDMKRYL